MFKWRQGTLLVWDEAVEVPPGYVEVRPGVYKPNCAECVFRRYTTHRKSKQPEVEIHCLKLRKDVSVEECRECPHATVDAGRLLEIKPWIKDRPWYPAAEVKKRIGMWEDCKHRKRTKGDCNTCSKRLCMNPQHELFQLEVQITDCSECEVRECDL
jgi:hypothetical protein